MHQARTLWLFIAVFLTGCFLLDELEEEDVAVYAPGTTAASQGFTVDPAIEVHLLSRENAGVRLPPNALATATGAPPTGWISVVLTVHTFDLTQPWNIPGGFLAETAAGSPVALTEFGVVEINLADVNGNPLELKPGVTGEIRIPSIYGGPETLSLWSWNEARNVWIEDASATLVEGSYVGAVSHLSKWTAATAAARACIQGGVFDEAGFAVPDTKLTAVLADEPGLSGGETVSDSEGRYRFDGVSAGKVYRITAYGFETSDTTDLPIPASATGCAVAEALVVDRGMSHAAPAEGAGVLH